MTVTLLIMDVSLNVKLLFRLTIVVVKSVLVVSFSEVLPMSSRFTNADVFHTDDANAETPRPY